jgi:hypothetical protein
MSEANWIGRWVHNEPWLLLGTYPASEANAAMSVFGAKADEGRALSDSCFDPMYGPAAFRKRECA